MGVHGLWELLAPVGRRVSVETLAGKKLAIDASIWMIQFMKAMRDERGEMVRNAHILGFFRRICKLLFLRTKPVFVFDGATPALKRRTVIARRRQRENAQAKIRKTAEKLLLNHLKAMRLKELANDLENQRQKNGDKGKRVITEEPEIAGNSSKTNPHVPKSYDQEALDAMLAASIAAEEGEGFIGDASTSGSGVLAEDKDGDGDGDEDDDEEMLLPTLQGKVDPAVLAALPPSMQLDLLVQMRERLMAENRQKYQKVKKAPASFSELQIQAYLKTVAFRREIDEVRKAAGGRGIGGVQTSRIASEANREFIFSSSFTGDRQALASAGVEANRNVQTQIPTKNPPKASVNGAVSTNKSIMNEPIKAFNKDVETYLDERGRVRVSKVRAMGIRMTRDLQRNLDLMKEIEQDRVDPGANSSNKTAPRELSRNAKLPETSYQENDGFLSPNETNQGSILTKGSTIEVSFEDDNEEKVVDSDDDIFARIVVGDSSSMKQPNGTTSDCEWEEGVPEDNKEERPLDGCRISDESEVEWEDGPSDNPVLASASEVKCRETVSRGALMEEADIQEAIRRSMEEMRSQKDTESSPSSASEDFDDNKNLRTECASFVPENLEKDGANDSSIEVVSGADALKMKLDSSSPNDPHLMKMEMEKSCESSLKCDPELSMEDTCDDHISRSPDADVSNVTLADGQQHEVKDMVVDHITETPEPREAIVKELKTDFNLVQKVTDVKDSNDIYEQKEEGVDKFDLADMSKEQVEITKANLEEEMENLTKERTDLGDEQRRLERNAESVSGEMFAECQELLQMFGLPYIIAPMEAEAQCAFMELENLVDGVVTDDSDVFLFGSRSVYKNIFDDRKYVETYFMKDIETELGLTREKLIRMAMLLGSDYTEGISGIGIVNAVEVLNAFPEEDGLHKFREWIESPDPTILGKVTNQSKRGSNSNGNQGVSNSDDDIQTMKQIFMDKHRNVSKNWHIPSTFPSDAVVSAYASPQVDKSTEPFSWGKPDLFVLRKLCWEKFGWGTQKADELLQPVLKEYNKHETQLRLEAFYTFNERFAKIRSKRINKAVKGIAGSRSLELMDDNEVDVSKGRKRRKVKHMESQNDTSKEHLSTRDESNSTEKSQKTKEKSTVRGRGKGRGRSIGRGRRTKNAAVTSSDDENNSDDVQEVHAEDFKGKHQVRRSKRARKSVKYTNDEDFEIDEHRTEEDHAEAADDGDPFIDKETLSDPPAMAATGSNDDKLRKPSNESRFSGDVENDETTHELDLITSKQDGCQNDETTPEYLKMGGGFCLDEDETGKEQKDSCCSPTTTVDLDTGTTNESIERSDVGGSNVGSDPVVEVSRENVEEDDARMRPVSYFSAIPNLRRKRKKI